jgi:hypothetical protein
MPGKADPSRPLCVGRPVPLRAVRTAPTAAPWIATSCPRRPAVSCVCGSSSRTMPTSSACRTKGARTFLTFSTPPVREVRVDLRSPGGRLRTRLSSASSSAAQCTAPCAIPRRRRSSPSPRRRTLHAHGAPTSLRQRSPSRFALRIARWAGSWRCSAGPLIAWSFCSFASPVEGDIPRSCVDYRHPLLLGSDVLSSRHRVKTSICIHDCGQAIGTSTRHGMDDIRVLSRWATSHPSARLVRPTQTLHVPVLTGSGCRGATAG